MIVQFEQAHETLSRESNDENDEIVMKTWVCCKKWLRYKTKHGQSSKGSLAKYHFLVIYYYSLTDYTLFTQTDVHLLPKIANRF